MTLNLLIFLSIFIVFLLTATLPVYFSFAFFLKLQKLSKILLFSFLILSSLSFILSSSLIHRFDNFFTKSFYYLSSLWMGALAYLFFLSLLTLLFYYILSFSSFNIKPSYFAVAIMILTSLALVFSFLNARKPIIKSVEVEIKNLPEYWENKKIVHLSDIHLGAIHGEKYMNYIADKVNEIKPEIVLVTGDLFDGASDGLEASIKPINKINAPSGMYYITGNHEVYIGLERSLEIIDSTKLAHLSNRSISLNDLQIIGLDYPERGKSFSVGELFNSLDKEKPSILMTHEPIKIDYFKNTGINLQLAGHTHKGQMFPFGFVTKIIYKGYDYGLFTEGDYNLYTTNGTGTWGPPLRSILPSEIVEITLKRKAF